MMIANLVRKDFLLVKKSAPAFLGISVFAMLLLIILMSDSARIQETGKMFFFYMMILIELRFMQTVATEEEKNIKAKALLCASPYSRESYVIAKYICYLIFYAGCVAAYSIAAVFYRGFVFLNVSELLMAFMLGTVLYGVYTPVAIKYGVSKAGIVFTAAVLIMALGPTLVVRVFRSDTKLFVPIMRSTSSVIIPVVLGVAGVGFFLISMMISIRIFEKKEL